jgi:hypothetical protein
MTHFIIALSNDRGRYYVHNGVGVVAACEVTAARKTVAADRTPFMARRAAAIEARDAFGMEDV